jgi:hypothetical protein
VTAGAPEQGPNLLREGSNAVSVRAGERLVWSSHPLDRNRSGIESDNHWYGPVAMLPATTNDKLAEGEDAHAVRLEQSMEPLVAIRKLLFPLSLTKSIAPGNYR